MARRGTGSRTLIVARYEFMKTVKKKGFIITAVLLPLIMMGSMILAFDMMPQMTSSEVSGTGFVDLAGFIEGDANHTKYASTDEGIKALLDGDISSLLVVPGDYLGSGGVTVYSRDDSILSGGGTGIDEFLTVNLLRYAGVDNETAERIREPYTAKEIITLDGDGNPKDLEKNLGDLMTPYAFAILLLMGIMTSSGYLMQGIGEEKEGKTGEVLLSSISAEQLLRGKILGYGMVGLFQMMIWVMVATLVFTQSRFAALLQGIELTWVFGLALVYFILGYFLYAVSMACAAAISPTAKEAQQTSGIFTMFAVIPMAFSQLIVINPESMMARALTFFPYTAPFITLLRMPLTTIPTHEIILSLVILLAAILLLAKIAAKIFRMGMLMQGKKATIREVIGFVREG